MNPACQSQGTFRNLLRMKLLHETRLKVRRELEAPPPLNFFVHSNLGLRFGLVEKVLVTPRFHRWHHGIEKEAIDVNFAIHFPLLDRFFGTYHMPEDGRWLEGYGIKGPLPKGCW